MYPIYSIIWFRVKNIHQRERYENWYLSDLATNNLHLFWFIYIAQEMKFSIKDFSS